jgi:phosphoglucomutase
VLYYVLENDGWFCVRPSGTEPKIKLYMGVKGSNAADAQRQIDALSAAAFELIGDLS